MNIATVTARMKMNNLIPVAIGGASAAAYFWPQILSYFSSNPDKPPHSEMNTVINFFKEKHHKPGLDSAMNTGKLIYDALTQETQEVNK